MKEAKEVYAIYAFCPYCKADVSDWLRDPRGEETKCDECKKTFKVSEAADIHFQ